MTSITGRSLLSANRTSIIGLDFTGIYVFTRKIYRNIEKVLRTPIYPRTDKLVFFHFFRRQVGLTYCP